MICKNCHQKRLKKVIPIGKQPISSVFLSKKIKNQNCKMIFLSSRKIYKLGDNIRKFRSSLNSRNYTSAYRELISGDYIPSGDEINTLKNGLEDMGILSQLRKDKLENYLS